MDFLVLQHLDTEPPCLIGDVLLQQGHTLRTLRVDRGEALPEHAAGLSGVIVMGGPQSANDTHLPWLRDELHWLGQRIAEGLPMLGICLGSQMMAKAAGGSVGPSPRRELGWLPIWPTDAARDDPLFTTLPEGGMTVFQWHGETFDLPDSASLLATNPDVPAQAFRLGVAQYGLQFHVEVDEACIAQWVIAGQSEREHLGEAGINTLHSCTPEHLETMRTFCKGMTLNWLSQIR